MLKVWVSQSKPKNHSHCTSMFTVTHCYCLRFKYTTKFSLPKIACPAIVYAISVVFIGPFFVCVSSWIKVYRYNPTKIWQRRLQGVRNVAQKLCSCERSFRLWKMPQAERFLTSLAQYIYRDYHNLSSKHDSFSFTNQFNNENFITFPLKYHISSNKCPMCLIKA